MQNLQIDYDRQTEQLDKERGKVEAAEKQIAELTKRLSIAVTQVAQQTHSNTSRAHALPLTNKNTPPNTHMH